MSDTSVRAVPRPEKFRSWYVKNRDATSQRRRERYKTDAKYRAKIKKQAIRYRKNRMQGQEVQRTHMRKWRGVPTRVFTSGHVVDVVGCTYYQLRGWEDRGWIPASLFEDRHRLYLKHQVALIKALHEAVLKGGANPDKPPLKKVLVTIRANWKAA